MLVTFSALMMMVCASAVHAQQDGAPPPPDGGNGGGGGGRRMGGGGGGGGGGFDPAQMQQRMLDRIKEQMNASDDEWKVLQPKLEKVMTAQRDSMAGRFGGFRGGRGPGGGGGAGGGGGNGGPGGPGGDSPVAHAQQDLRTTLENTGATADEISAKLTALRDARTKAKTDLEAAQKDLKEVLTQRQEAVLVMSGMLD